MLQHIPLSQFVGTIARAPRASTRQFVQWPIVSVAVATALMSAVFILWPELDKAATMLFYNGAGGFPAREVRALALLHRVGVACTYVVIGGLLVVLLAKLFRTWAREVVTWRAWWFLTLGLTLGPGLLVNGLLKPILHRPRPERTDLFGGHQEFVAAWSFGEHGFGNRSFVSGEAAAAMYLVAFAFVVPVRWRPGVAVLALLWAFAVSLNRVAFGAHYLSDVLVAWGLMLTVVMLLRSLLLPDNHLWHRAEPD